MTTKKYADLHVHTNFSDGVFTPEEAVDFAKAVGLSAISITDHDITDSIPIAAKRGMECGIEVIAGVELSAELDSGKGKSELHILGYMIDWKNTAFQDKLTTFRQARKQRAKHIISKLLELGITIDETRLEKIAGIGAIGRLHFAKALIENGSVRNITDAFQRFLGHGKPAYVPKLALSPSEAINMILDAGGVPVLAHPLYAYSNNDNIVSELVAQGLKGIEVWHSKHPPYAVKKFSDIAFELGIISTGGSDCHGSFAEEPPIMGKLKISYQAVIDLKKCKEMLDNAKK